MENLIERLTDNEATGNGVADKSEIIKIIGVGGAGCNAVNNMCEMGIEGVNLVVCNTDLQALNNSPVTRKIQLGKTLTEGLGAGNDPNVGRDSAIEAKEEIDHVLADNTKMVFVTAGMGGGTGTGAAPVIAKQAKDKGILTIGIVSIPYSKEGKPRLLQAIKGAEEMSECVDSLLVVNTDRIYELYKGQKLRLTEGFKKGDNVLALAAKGLAEIITKHNIVNVDFADVSRALKDSGCSIMGTADAKGEDRAKEALLQALDSPLLNNNDIWGATHVIANITTSVDDEAYLEESGFIQDYLNEKAGGAANGHVTLITGFGVDENLESGVMRVTVIATGFSQNVFGPDNQSAINVDLTEDGRSTPKPDTDGEGAVTVTLYNDPETEHLNSIMERVYNHSDAPEGNFDPKQMRPATSLPLDKLSEEVLTQLEQEPAYKRRTL